MTIQRYSEDTYVFSGNAMIEGMGSDERGFYIILDETIFYPQGGGQPSDIGLIKSDDIIVPIVSVRAVEGEIRHYADQAYEVSPGAHVVCEIDGDRRIKNAKLHTAGHLIANILEKLYQGIKANKGHHFPCECYVEFSAIGLDATDVSLDVVNTAIQEVIAKAHTIEFRFVEHEELKILCPDLPYSIPSGKKLRVSKIGDFPYQPCGGTHVSNTSELSGLFVHKFKLKGGDLKIYYDIAIN